VNATERGVSPEDDRVAKLVRQAGWLEGGVVVYYFETSEDVPLAPPPRLPYEVAVVLVPHEASPGTRKAAAQVATRKCVEHLGPLERGEEPAPKPPARRGRKG
jgi:hypothetical protein